ncbi:MAG TPA: M28 family peptidase [Gemmataceae bacterium]|nr:M28 family peptidase [Gemmataceae bacterium]
MPRWTVGIVLVVAAVLALGGYRMFTTPSPAGDEFAQDRAPAAAGAVAFDGKRAMGYLEEICKLGPRMSGTESMTKQQELVKKHFEACGATVELQKFTARQASQKKPVDMANLIGSWHPERMRRVILCSHYDTRPIADQEENIRKWHEPFISANDGGSGVALLMELANHMKELKTDIGVDFVLFDGEEYIFDPEPGHDKYFFGSEHFAQMYQRDRPKHRYIGAVLLDMIAGKNLQIPIEEHSLMQARALVDDLWNIAAELKCTVFQNRPGEALLDDHLALNRAGIPAVDLIDFHYPHWHRLSDIPANCAPEGMSQVARVLSVWLQRVK